MTGVMTLYRSTIGKKAIMAVTGVILLGFVFVHMWGNLKVFAGAEELNVYAVHLRELGKPIFSYGQVLWIFRVVLLAAVGLHIWSGVSLWMRASEGRPVGYDKLKGVQPVDRYASYTMRWGGIVIALFIIFHLLHFTFGAVGYGWGNGEFVHPEGGAYSVYENVINGFQVPLVSLFYMLAMLALGLHIYHGSWSLFQTLGWNNTGYSGFIRSLAMLFALVIVVGNISMPLAVMLGFIQ
jgi:succinate dehydrogenase / fumarate reductase cytochrome b subunit